MTNYHDIALHVTKTCSIPVIDIIAQVLLPNAPPVLSTNNGYCSIEGTRIMFPEIYVETPQFDIINFIWKCVDLTENISPIISYLLSLPQSNERIISMQKTIAKVYYYHPTFLEALRIGRPDLQMLISSVYLFVHTRLKTKEVIDHFVETVLSTPITVNILSPFYSIVQFVITNCAIVTKDVTLVKHHQDQHITFTIDKAIKITTLKKDHLLLFCVLYFSDTYSFATSSPEYIESIGAPVHLDNLLRTTFPSLFFTPKSS